MQKILLLVAMPEELPTPPNPDMILVHMGIGKVNAAWQTVRALERYKPDLVINFGTAGVVMPEIRGLVEVGAACQRDMDVRALGVALGYTPFEADSHLIRFANSPLLCGTGDSFAASRPELPCDLVDVELYAVAKVCRSGPLNIFQIRRITPPHKIGGWCQTTPIWPFLRGYNRGFRAILCGYK